MSVDEDVLKFEEWALKMGCPSEAIPPRSAMRRIFQSGQALAFNEMMRRVRPNDEIKHMKDNIAVHKIKKIMESKLPPQHHQDVPEPLARYMAVKCLKGEVALAEESAAKQKAEYLQMKSWVNEKNIERIQQTEKLAELQAKHAMLNQKERMLDAELVAEKNITQHIRSATPLKIDGTNANEDRAKQAIQEAVAELKAYYLKCDNNGEASPADRDDLWDKMHVIFADIPNYILWNCLCAMKDRQLAEIGVMSQINIANLLQVDNTSANGDDATISGYKVALGKMYALHVSLMVEMRLGRVEKEKLVNDYVLAYNTFVVNIKTKFGVYNKEDVSDELLSAFVTQFTTQCYRQSQIAYLERVVAENKVELVERTNALKDHSVLKNSYRCICEDIEELYCKTQEDMRSLASVKDKIKSNEEFLSYLVEQKNEASTMKIVNGAGCGNESSGADSSTFSSEESFASFATDTTINTTMGGNRTDIMVNRTKIAMVVPHLVKEFKLFLDVPISKFKRAISVENALELQENTLFHPSIISVIPKQMQSLLPGHSMTSNAFLEYVSKLVAWKEQQEQLLLNLDIDVKPIVVDMTRLDDMKRRQIEAITEILDETQRIGQINKAVLQRLQKYMDFLKENPLRKYIPKSRLFNGRCYQEYEDEFMMYYNIIVAQKEQQ